MISKGDLRRPPCEGICHMTKREQFENFIKEKGIVLLDGAMGTMLQQEGAADKRVPEAVNLSHPEIVRKIHDLYIDAGSDIILSCSFGVSEYKLAGTEYKVEELIEAAVRNARASAEAAPRKVLAALDIGPLGRLVEPNGDLTFEEAYEAFRRQVVAGEKAGADLICLETFMDLREIRAAVLAAVENTDLPVLATMTFEKDMRTFTGTAIGSMALTLQGLGVSALGVNCSLGPQDVLPIIAELRKWTDLPLIAKPNAGLPDPETGTYGLDSRSFAEISAGFPELGVKFMGGCCGTDPGFIKALKDAVGGMSPAAFSGMLPSAVCSAEETVEIAGPVIVGERINPTGKKKLKEAYREHDLEHVISLASGQVEMGADILDVNTGLPDIDEKEMMSDIIKALAGVVTKPLMLDSGKPEVLEKALREYCGKAIVNSVNGSRRSMDTVLPLARKYGAAVVALTLDEEGIPKTVEKRLEIAVRIAEEAERYGIPKRDIFVDPLTLTVSAEQDNAANTLDALARLREMGLKTNLGVSNISFGLPNRPLINRNFLQMALTRGLDLAIIDPFDREMVGAVDVYKLIAGIDRDAASYIERHAGDSPAAGSVPTGNGQAEAAGKGPAADPLDEAVRKGMTGKVLEITGKELENRDPLEVIEKVLIPVLDRAGDDFEKGKIFIPQLIVAANTAGAAFDLVKEKMGKEEGPEEEKGGTSRRVVIATVKGDIHDIGKNIVRVIMENYGYDIIDLGKDVSPETILDAVLKYDVKLLGLSALMTTTLPNMAKTIELIKEKAPGCRIMTGGAVLTEDHAMKIGADYYVKDAKASCDAAKEVFSDDGGKDGRR